MRPPAHLIASMATGCLTGYAFSSVEAGLASFFAGILIDVDHIVDYLNRSRRHSFRDFLKTTLWGPQGRLYLFLHGWEYLPLLVLISLYDSLHAVAWGSFWGIAVHLAMDQFYNRAHPLTYFILFRWYCVFAPACFFKSEDSDADNHIIAGRLSLRPWKESSS